MATCSHATFCRKLFHVIEPSIAIVPPDMQKYKKINTHYFRQYNKKKQSKGDKLR